MQDGVYDAFTKRLAETAGAMKVADGLAPGAVIGPLNDMKAVEKVEAHIATYSSQIVASVHPSSSNSAARSGASATEKNSSSCGGGTDVPLSIACAWPR